MRKCKSRWNAASTLLKTRREILTVQLKLVHSNAALLADENQNFIRRMSLIRVHVARTFKGKSEPKFCLIDFPLHLLYTISLLSRFVFQRSIMLWLLAGWYFCIRCHINAQVRNLTLHMTSYSDVPNAADRTENGVEFIFVYICYVSMVQMITHTAYLPNMIL